jgi:hypothetical protein
LHLTLRRGRLHLTLLWLLLSLRCRWRLNLTLASLLLSRRRGRRLHLTLLRGRLYLTLLRWLLSRRCWWWLNLTSWRRLARPLRRLFLLFLISLRRLGDHKQAIEWCGVRRSKHQGRQYRADQQPFFCFKHLCRF